jgi:hypothetical protein
LRSQKAHTIDIQTIKRGRRVKHQEYPDHTRFMSYMFATAFIGFWAILYTGIAIWIWSVL